MGIHDRDYMKRRPSHDGDDAAGTGRDGARPDENLEAFLGGFLRRHPRFLTWCGVGLAVLVVAGIVFAVVSAVNSGP